VITQFSFTLFNSLDQPLYSQIRCPRVMDTPYDTIAPSGPSKPSSVLIVSTFLPVLSLVAVAFRFNVRRITKAEIQFDDWLMIPAIILVAGMSICGIIGVNKNIWGHLAPAPTGDILNSSATYEGKLLTAFQYIQILALANIKLGALAFYQRIFATPTKSTFKQINVGTIVIVCLFAIGMLFGNTFQCDLHVDALWLTPDDYYQYCHVSSPAFNQVFTIMNSVLDLWILLLPLPKIFAFQTTLGRKFAISGVFLLALVGVAASCTRMAYTIQMFHSQYDPRANYRLQDTVLIFWSNLESTMCLLAVNLPSLWGYKNSVRSSQIFQRLRSFIVNLNAMYDIEGQKGSK